MIDALFCIWLLCFWLQFSVMDIFFFYIQVLMCLGPVAVRRAIEDAELYPIKGLFRFSNYFHEIDSYYNLSHGNELGVTTGWNGVDEFYRVGRFRHDFFFHLLVGKMFYLPYFMKRVDTLSYVLAVFSKHPFFLDFYWYGWFLILFLQLHNDHLVIYEYVFTVLHSHYCTQLLRCCLDENPCLEWVIL